MKHGDYVDAYDRNIQYIQNIILKQTLSINTRGFFQPLTDDELLFIYSKLEIPHDYNTILTTKWFNNEHLLIVNYTKDNIKHNAFYDKKRVLGIDFVIANQEKDEHPDEHTDDQ